MNTLSELGVLAALAVLPPFLFTLYVRSRETQGREPMGAILARFLYGATLGVAIAIGLSVAFDTGFAATGRLGLGEAFFATVIIAPFVEEFAKGIGLAPARRHLDEPEDGIIHGAAIGLGFAATENFVYGVSSLLDEGLQVALTVIAFRVLTSTILHASSTALIGYAYSRIIVRGGVAIELLPLYLLAVLLHGAYNFLVMANVVGAFVAAVVVTFAVAGYLRREIVRLDRMPHHIH